MSGDLNTAQTITIATKHLENLRGHTFDIITISKPPSFEAAVNLSKIISKLSPILGNLIEFNVVDYLNEKEEFAGQGRWNRQDPGFPDAVFRGIEPVPGFEIKAWFPLATEITARFKESRDHLNFDNTHVCMLAWLPEHIIYGIPKIVGVVVVSGISVADARDNHYHNPPNYLVLEPEDTSDRTRNLQQTTTTGYRLQDVTENELSEARRIVQSWGVNGANYETSPEYQNRLRELTSRFTYRLDTNFAKMDRITHPKIEEFKKRIEDTEFESLTIGEWRKIFACRDDGKIRQALGKYLGITDEPQIPE